jgi:hypothetical protein
MKGLCALQGGLAWYKQPGMHTTQGGTAPETFGAAQSTICKTSGHDQMLFKMPLPAQDTASSLLSM